MNVNNKTSSKLDLIFSNCSKWYKDPVCCPPIKDGIQFHVGIELTPVNTMCTPKTNTTKISYRDYSSKSVCDFAELIECINWTPLFASSDIDFMVAYFNLNVNAAFEIAFPSKVKYVTKTDRQWITAKLKLQFRKLRRIKVGSAEYKRLRVAINEEMRKAKLAYCSKLETKLTVNANNIHKIVNSISGSKKKLSVIQDIGLASGTSDRILMLNAINSMFANVNNRYEAIGKLPVTFVTTEPWLQVNELMLVKCFDKLSIKK